MKQTNELVIPLRSVFTRSCLEAIFGESLSAGKFATQCHARAKELGLVNEANEAILVEENSSIHYFLTEMNSVYQACTGKADTHPLAEDFTNYGQSLHMFFESNSGSLSKWLKDGSNGTFQRPFEVATFFTLLLLNVPQASMQRTAAWLEIILTWFGITLNESDAIERAVLFDLRSGVLDNTAAHALMFAMYALCSTYTNSADATQKSAQVYAQVKDLLREATAAQAGLDAAERILATQLQRVEPRSITTVKNYSLSKVFVAPRMQMRTDEGGCEATALSSLAQEKYALIVGKTGLGKSAYLQMRALCTLHTRCGVPNLTDVSEQLGTDDTQYVLHIPARMFSFCYNARRQSETPYRAWTTDLIDLFFYSTWRLSAQYNFCSTDPNRQMTDFAHENMAQHEVNDALRAYLQHLAQRGKLILSLDSYDEIFAGEMRTAYLEAIAQFYNDYCNFPENPTCGARVLLSSREMSTSTMSCLKAPLDGRVKTYEIASLCEEQRIALVTNWHRFMGKTDAQELDTIIESLRTNHYYTEYASNPYMLSVVYHNFGKSLKETTTSLVDSLIQRMQTNHSGADATVRGVLADSELILQTIALSCARKGSATFTKDELAKQLRARIPERDAKGRPFTAAKMEESIKSLHEIFVTEAGLIVPADGNDSDYQFINAQIRYELAAQTLKGVALGEDDFTTYQKMELARIQNAEHYVGVLVALLSACALENITLSALLSLDFTSRPCATEHEETCMARGLVDLLLGRHGPNIIAAKDPGDDNADLFMRAQKSVLMRLLTSSARTSDPTECAEIKQTAAYEKHHVFFHRDVTASF